MARARRRTFRLRPLDEWALDTARHAQGEGVDFTAALQLLIDLGVEAGVEKGYWQPYQAPGVQDRPDPAKADVGGNDGSILRSARGRRRRDAAADGDTARPAAGNTGR